MKTLVESVEIIDINSPWNHKIVNVLINNNLIEFIGNDKPTSDQVIDATGFKLSPGWIDMRCSLRDPGFEFKEDIFSGISCAAEGGFTEIVCLPNTQPGIQSKDVVEYIKSRAREQVVSVYPMGYVSVDGLGKELTEMIDMHTAGAVAFTDAENAVWDTGLLSKALQYLQTFNGLLINHPEDTNLTRYGQMNEGKNSTLLGLKGIPKIAEEMMIIRDLELLKYTGGRIHFSRISSSKSVEIIRNAKKKGQAVTCDIASHQLAFDDNAMFDFDTNLKINPPFRLKEDIDALIKGLLDNTIDVMVSDHCPQDIESKKLEFDLAEFGVIGLETSFAVANTILGKKMDLQELLNKICLAPRKLLSLAQPQIKEGNLANLTLFSTDLEWTYGEYGIKSKSKNSPFIGKKLIGKSLAVFNNGKLYRSQYLQTRY